MKRTLIFAAIFALLAMIYVPKAMHTYQGSNVGGGYRFIFDQRNTSVAFFQLLVNILFASSLGALLARVPKCFLIIGAMIVAVYVGITSITAMICNDNGNDLLKQRKYTEAAQAYHQAACSSRTSRAEMIRITQIGMSVSACVRFRQRSQAR